MHTIFWLVGIYLAVGIIVNIIIRRLGVSYDGKWSNVIFRNIVDILFWPLIVAFAIIFILIQWYMDIRGGFEQPPDSDDDDVL